MWMLVHVQHTRLLLLPVLESGRYGFKSESVKRLGAAIEDALPLLHGGASYASDEQREGVHLQRGDAREDGADVVRPPRVKVARRRFLRRMSTGIVGSNRAGPSR